jgi:site-specific recombinase XerD
LLKQFPSRQVPARWPATAETRDKVLKRLTTVPFVSGGTDRAGRGRKTGVVRILDWLSSLPGDTWQERWKASGAEELGLDWVGRPAAWLKQQNRAPEAFPDRTLRPAVLLLICADVIRPDWIWLLVSSGFRDLVPEMARTRDPAGFVTLSRPDIADGASHSCHRQALRRVAAILGSRGGRVVDVTVGDCLHLGVQAFQVNPSLGGGFYFYQLLHALKTFPDHAPASVRMLNTQGQLSVEQMVDRYDINSRPVRDLFVDYLRELEVSRDYTTLRDLASTLCRPFWRDLELHHPGIESLHLPASVAAGWKKRVMTKTKQVVDGRGEVVEVRTPRASAVGILIGVRSFYLDLAQWAADEPARWGPWAVPCPIKEHEIPYAREVSHRKARMDQRTRERLPALPALAAGVQQERRTAAELLQAAQSVPFGERFTAAGLTFLRPTMSASAKRPARIWAQELDTGERHDLTLREHRAFWSWAAVEVLRHTGMRVEELTELSHHSFVQYRLPTTGELIPLLQIAPSKSDSERLLVISPELADVLSTIISRVRGEDGAVPLAVSYDTHEGTWNPPMPLLFQRRLRGENRPVPTEGIRNLLKRAVADTGLTDSSGQPLSYTPHDFRRLFVTDAILNGMPPHIAQLVCGHRDINTTMGYKTVYPEEVINGHRAFIARRRALRPSAEYRTPTNEEWEEFLGHFERRKVALGTCGRAFGTSCSHEHACLRCSLLRPDPTQRPRLIEVRDNLLDRIAEAEREGWLGEMEGLRVSLSGAEQKLEQLTEATTRSSEIDLGMPSLTHFVGRDIHD